MKKYFKLFGIGLLLPIISDLTFPSQDDRLTFWVTALIAFVIGVMFNKAVSPNRWVRGVFLLIPFILFLLLIAVLNPVHITYLIPMLAIAAIPSIISGLSVDISKKKRTSLLIGIWLAFVGISTFYIIPRANYYQASEVANEAFPDFKLTSIDGTAGLSKNDLRNKVVLIDFWGNYCGACFRQLPYLEEIKTKFEKYPDVLIITINDGRESIEKARAAVERQKISLPVWFDEGTALCKSLNIDAVPRLYILDKKGNIREKHEGFERAQASVFVEETIGKIEELRSE